MCKYQNLPQHVKPSIAQTWLRMHAMVPSTVFSVLGHLCAPHLLPMKLAAVSPIPTVSTPLSNVNSVKLLLGIQRGNDKPHSRYMGVNERKVSFSSTSKMNPWWKKSPKGGIFKSLII